MRVLHVIGPLRTGGAQTQLLGLVRAAHGKLWDATVVATSGGPLATEFAALGCPFEQLRRIGSPGLLRMRRLRQIVADGEFDVVHGNLWQSNLYCRAAVIGRRTRPAVVISERNVEDRRSAWQRWLDSVMAGVTDAYVGNTDAVSDFIRRVHRVTDQDVVTIPNAVDTSVFHFPASARRDKGIRIGSVGRLDAEKGLDILIEAVRALVEDGFDASLAVAGTGPLREALEVQAEGLPVTFVGPLNPGRDVAEFLRSVDVFALASTHREGRPNAILEALACGLPVVATDIDGIREILHGPSLVPPGDPGALADALATAADKPAEWLRVSDPAPITDFGGLAQRYREVFERSQERTRRR